MELLELAGYKSSYIHMSDLVDHFFPPVRAGLGVDEAYTDLRYWKLPLVEISDESDNEDDEGEDEGEDEEEYEDEGDEGDEGDEVYIYLTVYLTIRTRTSWIEIQKRMLSCPRRTLLHRLQKAVCELHLHAIRWH
jgi:hypothetical protein